MDICLQAKKVRRCSFPQQVLKTILRGMVILMYKWVANGYCIGLVTNPVNHGKGKISHLF